MNLVKAVFYILLAVAVSVVLLNVLIGMLIFNIKLVRRFMKIKYHPSFKRTWKRLKTWKVLYNYWWHNISTTKVNDFVRLCITDLFLKDKGFSLYGIYTFVGYFGEGKTLGMVRFARHIKRQYADRGIEVHIAANFKLKDQDIFVTSWTDILNLPRNTILLFDEIHTTFDTHGFSDFPLELLTHLTQQRKRKLAIFTSTQVFKQAVVQVRRITAWVVICKNRWHRDRWFSYDFYHKDKFEALEDSASIMLTLNKKVYREYNYNFVALDSDYNAYDTENMITAQNIKTEKNVNRKRQKRYDEIQQYSESA